MADATVEEVPVAADAPAVTAEAVEKPAEAVEQTGDAVADAQGACCRAPRLRVARARRRAGLHGARGFARACAAAARKAFHQHLLAG